MMSVVAATLLVGLASMQGGETAPLPIDGTQVIEELALEEPTPDSLPALEEVPLDEPLAGSPSPIEGFPLDEPFLDVPEPELERPRGLVRTTIVPWSVQVLGREYDSFTNTDASIVLTDWLEDALIGLKVFTVLNRDRIQAVLSERQLAASADGLASAGRLESVDYILEGNFKNLGRSSEVAFKVLDVKTAKYIHRLSYPIAFNPQIESTKAEIDRLVAKLAAEFPAKAWIEQILGPQRVLIAAGSENGIVERMTAELWRVDGSGGEAAGVVRRVGDFEAEVEFTTPVAGLNLFDYLVQIRVVPPAQVAMEEGRALFEAGDYAGAAVRFREGLEINPADGLLRADYARALWLMGDRASAVDAFRRALVLRPDDVPLLEDAAVAILEFGRSEELIEIMEMGDRRSLSVPLTLAYGLAKEVLGNFKGAGQAYQAALKNEPNSAPSRLRLAVLAAKRGDLEETGTQLRMAAQMTAQPSRELEMARAAFQLVGSGSSEVEHEALAALAREAESAGDVAALSSASEVLALEPAEWEVSLRLAQSASNLNSDYLRATLAAARAYAAGGQNDSAIALLDTALSVDPSNVAMLLLSGDLLLRQERIGEAQSRYERARDLARDDWRPADRLGDLYTLLQDNLKAVGAYRQALEAFESSQSPLPRDLTERLRKVGNAAALANQLDTARPYLERCVAQAPERTDCQFNLGRCYFEDPAAASQAVAAFRAAPDVVESGFYLGELNLRRADRASAISAYRRCARDASCTLARQSQKQLDRLESMSGTVTKVTADFKRATLDLGRIHGVTHNMEGFVDLGKGKRGRLRIDEVRPDSSVAMVLQGKPRVGQTVRFGAASPRGVTVSASQKKGHVLRWRSSPEPEVVVYEIQRRSGPSGPWRSAGRVKRPKTEFRIKPLKPGETAYFRVIAVNKKGVKSAPSQVAKVGGA